MVYKLPANSPNAAPATTAKIGTGNKNIGKITKHRT